MEEKEILDKIRNEKKYLANLIIEDLKGADAIPDCLAKAEALVDRKAILDVIQSL